MTLKEFLKHLIEDSDGNLLLNDGAITRDIFNLLEFIEQEDNELGETLISHGFAKDGRLIINEIGKDGYIKSGPLFISDAALRLTPYYQKAYTLSY